MYETDVERFFLGGGRKWCGVVWRGVIYMYIYRGWFGTSEAKKTHVKKLAIEQNERLSTVLGAYKATPTAVLEAESNAQYAGFAGPGST